MEKERKFTVYMHTSPSGKKYIGITSRTVKLRWLNGKGYKGQVFEHAIEKYGWSNIKHEILYSGLIKQQACQMEMDLIKKYKANDSRYGYNASIGGEQPNLGSVKTPEMLKHLSDINKGSKNGNYGNHLSKEARLSIKRLGSGKNSKLYGKHLKKETLIKKSKPIYQFDVNGNFIKEWYGGREVTRVLGYASSSIYSACKKHGKIAKGFLWFYKNDDIFKKYIKNSIEMKKYIQMVMVDKKEKELYLRRKEGARPVLQIDPKTNKVIKEFISAASAARYINIDNSFISRVCREESNTLIKGYKFRYNGEYKNKPKVIHPRAIKHIYQYSFDGEFIKEWDSAKDIARYLDVDISLIYKTCTNKAVSTGGYYLSYEKMDKYIK